MWLQTAYKICSCLTRGDSVKATSALCSNCTCVFCIAGTFLNRYSFLCTTILVSYFTCKWQSSNQIKINRINPMNLCCWIFFTHAHARTHTHTHTHISLTHWLEEKKVISCYVYAAWFPVPAEPKQWQGVRVDHQRGACSHDHDKRSPNCGARGLPYYGSGKLPLLSALIHWGRAAGSHAFRDC